MLIDICGLDHFSLVMNLMYPERPEILRLSNENNTLQFDLNAVRKERDDIVDDMHQQNVDHKISEDELRKTLKDKEIFHAKTLQELADFRYACSNNQKKITEFLDVIEARDAEILRLKAKFFDLLDGNFSK
jgi:DNA-directed RNA polymerase specialized sigma subunit